jgi:hypothetical protein
MREKQGVQEQSISSCPSDCEWRQRRFEIDSDRIASSLLREVSTRNEEDRRKCEEEEEKVEEEEEEEEEEGARQAGRQRRQPDRETSVKSGLQQLRLLHSQFCIGAGKGMHTHAAHACDTLLITNI